MDEEPSIQQQLERKMEEREEEKMMDDFADDGDEWGDDGGGWNDEDMMDECAEIMQMKCAGAKEEESDEEDSSSEEEAYCCDDDDDDESSEADERAHGMTLKKKRKKKAQASCAVDARYNGRLGMGGYSEQREKMQQEQLFKQVEQTKEYQDTFYWKVLFERNTKHLIPINRFWTSLATHVLNEDDTIASKPFLSEYFLFATSSINEILCMLAMLNVSFNEENVTPQFKYGENGVNDRSVRVIAEMPTIVFAKELKQQANDNSNDNGDVDDEKTASVQTQQPQSISINVVYFDPSDRYTTDENGERMDKFVEKVDFRPGKLYGCLSILTNVSSIRQSVEILCQIPTGSIPLNGGFRTKTNFVPLSAYSVHKFEFFFYFPVIGAYRQYPVVVTKKNKIIGSSKKSVDDACAIVVKYADKNKKVDTESWKDVSLNGSDDDVLQYLKSHNLNALDLSRIYYRAKQNETFLDQLLALLQSQAYYDDNMWGLNLYFYKQAIAATDDGGGDEKSEKRFAYVREYLGLNTRFNSMLSPSFTSAQFESDDLEHNRYQYLEYIPLVNARAHLLGHSREILNDALKTQYEKCLLRCSYRSTSVLDLRYDDILSLLYYLLVQDRIDEALDIYAVINGNQSLLQEVQRNAAICFDYLRAYMALFVNEEDGGTQTIEDAVENAIRVATEIAAKYRNVDLIASKRKLFEDIEVLVSDLNDYKREDDGDQDAVIHGVGDRDRTMNKMAANTPSLDFVINETDRKLIISSANIEKVRVNFYTMNTEILFSNSPFYSSSSSSSSSSSNKSAFAYIAPNMSTEVVIQRSNGDSDRTEFGIPSELKNENLFVEVVSSTLNVGRQFFDNELNVLIQESYGQLKVLVPSQRSKNKLIPLHKAYVKVYAKTNGGSDEFYKDGYTDIRGKFDFASISTDQLGKTNKFAIFVKAEQYGSTVKEAKPPKS